MDRLRYPEQLEFLAEVPDDDLEAFGGRDTIEAMSSGRMRRE